MPWRTLYESCVTETNPDKLQKLVFQLEEAIVLRYHDLANEPDAFDEFRAMKRAAQRLLQMKIDKLAWPHPVAAVVSAIPASMPISLPTSMPVSGPASANDVRPDPAISRPRSFQTVWPTVIRRAQAALLVGQRAWQNWVFKSLK